VSDLRIGAQLYTVRGHTETADDVAVTFATVKAAGYTGVQVSAFGPVDPADVARLAAEHGLEIAATHFGWDEFLTDLDRMIDTHRSWGCRHAAIGGLPDEYREAGGIERFAAELGPVAERLAAAGIDFSYHNHNHELVRAGGRTWLAELYDGVPAEALKAELDVYWLVAGGADPVQWIEDLSGRQTIVHFKDMAMAPDRTQRFAEVGEGNLNWPKIVAACRAAEIEWAFVEQDDCYGQDPFACLATSYRNLRGLGLR
jgi:sugar phosphate isomerase/epimerase